MLTEFILISNIIIVCNHNMYSNSYKSRGSWYTRLREERSDAAIHFALTGMFFLDCFVVKVSQARLLLLAKTKF